MVTIRNEESAYDQLTGTYKVGSLDKVTYSDLIRVLGEPTFNEESPDGKVQVEWVVAHNEAVFAIYDWKTFDLDYTLNQLDTWSIGGKEDPTSFIEDFKRQLKRELESNLYV